MGNACGKADDATNFEVQKKKAEGMTRDECKVLAKTMAVAYFAKFDKNKDAKLSPEEAKTMFEDISKTFAEKASSEIKKMDTVTVGDKDKAV